MGDKGKECSMEIVIVTGISGSGKSSAANFLEDIGYFCIDNMPPQLLPKFAEICADNKSISKVAIVIDIRGGSFFFNLEENIESLRSRSINIKVLFVNADHEVVKKRYKETRRKHPLAEISNNDIDAAISAEFDMLQPIRQKADYYIDTSLMTTAVLKENVMNLFMEDVTESMIISCVSFGFKYGVPNEADLMFDVRCLPNPYYVPELKTKTGLDGEVREYVMRGENSRVFSEKLNDMIDFLIPQYLAEGKSQLVIAFGCTGGKHRSVTFAENMFHHLDEQKYTVRVLHRDISK